MMSCPYQCMSGGQSAYPIISENVADDYDQFVYETATLQRMSVPLGRGVEFSSDRDWLGSCGVHRNRDPHAARTIDREGSRRFEQDVAASRGATQNAYWRG